MASKYVQIGLKWNSNVSYHLISARRREILFADRSLQESVAKKIHGGFKRLFGKQEPSPPGVESLDSQNVQSFDGPVKSLDEPVNNAPVKSLDS